MEKTRVSTTISGLTEKKLNNIEKICDVSSAAAIRNSIAVLERLLLETQEDDSYIAVVDGKGKVKKIIMLPL